MIDPVTDTVDTDNPLTIQVNSGHIHLGHATNCVSITGPNTNGTPFAIWLTADQAHELAHKITNQAHAARQPRQPRQP